MGNIDETPVLPAEDEPISAELVGGSEVDRSARPHAWVLAGCIAVLLAAAVLDVRSTERVGFRGTVFVLPEICAFKRLTGAACPGCGLTRSFISFSRCDFRGGLEFNPVGLLLFVALVVQIPYRAVQLWRCTRRQPPWRLSHLGTWSLIIIIVLLCVQWILRTLGWSGLISG